MPTELYGRRWSKKRKRAENAPATDENNRSGERTRVLPASQRGPRAMQRHVALQGRGNHRTGTYLFVDPSILHMGWALFGVDEGKCVLRRYGVVDLGQQPSVGSLDWVNRADVMANHVQHLVSEEGVTCVGIEMPITMESDRGKAAQASGALHKLAFCVATIRSWVLSCRARPAAEVFHTCPHPHPHYRPVLVELVEVRRWKGTAPKSVTQNRVYKRWGVSGDHNMVDAIGLGSWYLCNHLGLRSERWVREFSLESQSVE